MLNARPQSDQVMQAAFQREMANLEQAKRMDDEHSQMLVIRQRAIKEKRYRARQKAASADHDRCCYGDIKILPLEAEISDETRQAEKQKLNQRLNEQVAAKVALKKDRRALDQAESAYFISKLMLQEENERQEMAERKRVEKETMLAGWSQQKAIQAQKKALKVHIK
ncbi:hypothetical protein JM18_003004 [Phytophthora kernoviae]|uniref:Uncharacterized protein n=2 Tax=Phytophthora kernoviae TaxID=325452 RepID=A0A8T0M2E9_9STRA|nr:hypothetical protein G195_004351 [Phytophthora kernoviae 00238/432]KAG2527505.1 hypothetical protein JM16_003431 [Phytophthora kernoviae]KAG2528781.1 hypothetical protein JM18_003004 [Phytophthora kernoviae]